MYSEQRLGRTVPHSETEYLEDVLKFERSVQYLKWQIPIGLMVLSALLILGGPRAVGKGGARAGERTASDSRPVGAAPLMEQARINR